MKERLSRAKETLPDGFCGRPLQKACPHPNACHTCNDFLTTAEFLPQHRDQLSRTRKLIAVGEANGQLRLVESNRQIEQNLVRIIQALEPKADNTAALLEATARRHERTVRSALKAIRELNAAGAEITFGGVAKRAGVARSSFTAAATCGLRSRSFGRPREPTAEQQSPRPRGHREPPSTSASLSR